MENENLLPAIWAGMECTISRTHDDFHDQLACGGYYTNDYLDHVLQLNPKAVRFPILWERHEPVQGAAIDWTWARSQLNKLREQGVAPIVGLLHHGSGPAFTDLADPSFPGLLAEYAGRVAQAFPWVQYWSPVNEPLTTARFSGLYGHWYPHKKNDRDFLKMLINQAKAIVLSMAAIREISPEAKLIQTEDLAKTYSSPALRYQASFENNRRWLSLDLLCGKLTEKHPLYNYFIDNGISAADLRFFQDNPCAPAIIGANYYITSERYLATDLANYPVHTHGGNGQHEYADVEAIRVPIKQANGPRVLLQELWNRYQLPIALTEVHLHCSREEQLRWFKYLFDVAAELRNSGVDIQAVTAWAVLGSFGWDQLLTCKSMNYESGAFDISAGYCRITALGTFIKNLPLKSAAYEPLLAMPGWWQRPSRFFKYHNEPLLSNAADIRPLLILGKRGTLGRAFFHICNRRNIHQVSLSRQEADVCEDLSALLKFYKPWAVINATGYLDVDAAEDDPSACENLNTAAVVKLASACQRLNIPLVNFSSDLVFDGQKQEPYLEHDKPRPLNIYGNSKWLAENAVLKANPQNLVIRTSAFFGPWDQYNFIATSMTKLLDGEKVYALQDAIVSPTYVPHLVDATLDLLTDGVGGICHLANKGSISWYDLALLVAEHYNLNTENIIPVNRGDKKANLPPYSALDSSRYGLMPALQKALAEFFQLKVLKETTPLIYEAV